MGLSTGMVRWLAAATLFTLLPSCFLIKVPVEAAGKVVGAGARVAEKTAVTGVEVAGKAAGAVIDGQIPAPKARVWDAFR